MLRPEGIIPALVTPFTTDGNVDESALRRLVRRTIDGGCHGVFCLGSNGEFFSLTEEEKVFITTIVVDEAGGEVPIYAGTGGNSTDETIQLTERMAKIGVAAVSVITPYFVKLSQEELIKHYEEIADSVDLPIILYNIPNLTGNMLLPETVATISKKDNIIAIKDSSGNFDHILQLIELVNPKFSVLIGTDSLILPGLMSGAQGAIAATANLLPQVVVQIYEKWKIGDLKGAAEEQRDLRYIRNAFKLGTMPSVLKEALKEAGMDVGKPRSPVQPVSEIVKRKVQLIIQDYRNQGKII